MTLLQEYLFRISQGISTVAFSIGYGMFWPIRQKAVIAFQKYYGYVADGLVGPTLWNDIVAAYQFVENE